MRTSQLTLTDLAALYDSWMLHLRAERKSEQTIKSYGLGVRLYLAWCTQDASCVPLSRRSLAAWVAQLLDQGAEASTAVARQLAVRRFSAWLAAEGEIERDDLLGVKPPKVDTKVTESLTDDQLKMLIKACAGREFRDRRDEAIIRLMAESALRSEELLSMTIPDTDLAHGVAIVRRGKGGKGRTVPFGPRTGAAIDRYLRARRTHRLADTPVLWLGDRGKGFAYYGLRCALAYRARLAGIDGFHNHLLRHTAAARWLDAGGTEGGLMAVAGWTRREMLDRYVRATSERRAAEEARRLGLGDDL
jgi:integrase/recombinase XerD